MSDINYQLKNPITIRTSEDERSLNEERIIEMFPEFDPETTTRVMFNAVVDRASKQTKKINQSLPADLETIQLLTNKNGELKTLVDLKDQEIQDLKDQISQGKEAHQQEVSQLGDSLQGLKAVLPTSNQVVVDLSPLQKQLILLASERLTARYKKEITPEQILKQIFINYTKQESELDFPYVLSYSDIVRLKNNPTQ
jgi:hypothetical protein